MTTPGNSIWEQELHASVDAILNDHLRNLQGRVEMRLRQAVHDAMEGAVREALPQIAEGVGNRIDQWTSRASRARVAHADPWPEWLSLLLGANRPAEALQALLYAVSSVSSRAAVYILRGGQASVWRASTGAQLPDTLPLREWETLRHCVEEPERLFWNPAGPIAGELPAGLGRAASGGCHPLRVHAKTIGFLYWELDEVCESGTAHRFDLLAQVTGMVLQNLAPAVGRASAATVAEPAAVPEPARLEESPAMVEPEPAAEPGSTVEAESPAAEPAPEAPRAAAAAAAAASSPAPRATAEAASVSAPAPTVPANHPLAARAQRYAKVLIQDLEIYLQRDRPGALALAREQRNIYGQLREELERARKSFWEKFPPSSGIDAEVLEQAIVRLLCDGDAGLLGPDYPGMQPVM